MKKTIQHTLVLFLMIGMGAMIAVIFATTVKFEQPEPRPCITEKHIIESMRIEIQAHKATAVFMEFAMPKYVAFHKMKVNDYILCHQDLILNSVCIYDTTTALKVIHRIRLQDDKDSVKLDSTRAMVIR